MTTKKAGPGAQQNNVAPTQGQRVETPDGEGNAKNLTWDMEGMEIMNTVDQWFRDCHKVQLFDTNAILSMWDEQTDQLEYGEALMRCAKLVEEFGLVGLLKLLDVYCHTVCRTAKGNVQLHPLMSSLRHNLSGLAQMFELAAIEVEYGQENRRLLKDSKNFTLRRQKGVNNG